MLNRVVLVGRLTKDPEFRTTQSGVEVATFTLAVNRNCVICSKPHAELAHYHAVGRGRNRRKIDHTDNKVLALCREHHTEQHNIGINSFNDKYHLHDSWVDVDERLNKMLKGESK